MSAGGVSNGRSSHARAAPHDPKRHRGKRSRGRPSLVPATSLSACPGHAEPLPTALACCAIAALLTLVMGVEAIAHERLVTPAIDPLAGFETRRMRVNFRYLSNTVEQFIVFAAGLLALAAYISPRLLVIVTIVWIVTRWAFWIGYHFSPLLRGIGAPGMLQSMIVLLYVAWRWGNDAYGAAAGILLLAIFVAIEAFLFWAVKRPSQ
jgi:hypothetical protein